MAARQDEQLVEKALHIALQQRHPINNHEDGINVLMIILGAYQSVEQRHTIEL